MDILNSYSSFFSALFLVNILTMVSLPRLLNRLVGLMYLAFNFFKFSLCWAVETCLANSFKPKDFILHAWQSWQACLFTKEVMFKKKGLNHIISSSLWGFISIFTCFWLEILTCPTLPPAPCDDACFAYGYVHPTIKTHKVKNDHSLFK